MTDNRIPVTLLSRLQGQLDQHLFIPGRTPLFLIRLWHSTHLIILGFLPAS
jgi:hypothetical protein